MTGIFPLIVWLFVIEVPFNISPLILNFSKSPVNPNESQTSIQSTLLSSIICLLKSELLKSIKSIKSSGVKVGISIKPGTNVSVLDELLPELDLILIMSVEPGKGGQKFIHHSLDKIEYLNKKRIKFGFNFLIEVDGGINFETAKLVKKSGNDVIVVGSFIFNKENRNELVKEFENVW